MTTKGTFWALALLAVLGSSWLGSAAAAADINPNTDAALASGQATDTAIVTLVDQPTASYDGHIAGQPATKPAPGNKLDLGSTPVKNYRAYLANRRNDLKQWLQQNGFKGAVVREYDLTLNALALQLNGKSADKLGTAPGVAAVEYSQLYHPTMNLSLGLIKAGIGNLGGTANGGQGVKVGVIDTGIDQTHPFFDPTGFSYPSGFPKNDSRCTGQTTAKVIVARVYFLNSNRTGRGGLTCAAVQAHGTHVAGTVGGVLFPGASATPVPVSGTLSGVAPGVWLGNYNVFPDNVASARSEDIAQAVEDAVADGMDVLNLSLGGAHPNGLANPDVLESALNHAADAGVVSAVAAGNAGPGGSTIESPGEAERVITAAASTNHHYFGIPVTVGGSTFGAALGQFGTFVPPVTAVLALASPSNGCTSITSNVTGAIAIIDRGTCTFSTKIRNAQSAGAVAVLVVNNVPGDPVGMAQDGTPNQPTIPAAMLALSDRTAIRSLVGQTATVDGTTIQEVITNNQNAIAAFSSAGPVDRTFAVKPDITGPGANVYSSVPDGKFALFSGTSMATPHTAGSAALLVQQHPSWTTDQIKSALVTTAQRVITTVPGGTVDPGVLRRGGGLIDLSRAGDVTASFSPAIVGFGVHEAKGRVTSSQSVILTNLTGLSATYSLSVSQAASSQAVFSVSPATLTVPADGSATFTVTLTSSGVTLTGSFKDFEGDVVVGPGPALRLPLWARFK
jgi:minor extracellular serine protease Vpr